MKLYVTLALASLLLTAGISVAAPGSDQMQAKETAAWQAFKDKKADDFKKVVGENMMAVYSDGVQDLQKEISGMQQWDMKSFTISDYKVTASGADTAVSTYTVKVEGTVGGKDASGTYYAGSVWKQEGSDWKAIFHTNIKAESGTK